MHKILLSCIGVGFWILLGTYLHLNVVKVQVHTLFFFNYIYLLGSFFIILIHTNIF